MLLKAYRNSKEGAINSDHRIEEDLIIVGIWTFTFEVWILTGRNEQNRAFEAKGIACSFREKYYLSLALIIKPLYCVVFQNKCI